MTLEELKITEKRLEKYYHENSNSMTKELQDCFIRVCWRLCEEIRKEERKEAGN